MQNSKAKASAKKAGPIDIVQGAEHSDQVNQQEASPSGLATAQTEVVPETRPEELPSDI